MNENKQFDTQIDNYTNGDTESKRYISYSVLKNALLTIKPTEITESRNYGLPTLVIRYDNVKSPYGSINGVLFALNIDKTDKEVDALKSTPAAMNKKILDISNRASKFYRSVSSKVEGSINIDGCSEELRYLDTDLVELIGSTHRRTV